MTARHGVTSNTPDRLIIDQGAAYLDYGLGGQRLLGATRGGSTFETGASIREIPVDGAKSPVRGFRRIERYDPILTVQLLEMTKQNLIDAIAGGNETSTPVTQSVDAEWIGDGDDAETDFSMENTDVVEDSEKVYLDTGSGPVLQTKGTDYTIVYSTGVVTMLSTPSTGDRLTASYSYETGDAATHDTITAGDIELADYFENVALVGEVSGTTNPVIVKVSNAIVVNALSLAMAPNDEVVSEIQFAGHADPSALTTVPFEIQWPRS